MNLFDVAQEIAQRLIRILLPNAQERRPVDRSRELSSPHRSLWRRRSHRGVACLTLATLLLHGGCSTIASPAPPSPEVKAQLGRLGLVAGRFVPTADTTVPPAGRGRGAARGAARGAGAVASGLSGGSCSGFACGLVVVLLLGGVIVGTAAGAIGGAITAESGETIHEAETILTHALSELRIQESLRDHVTTVAREDAGVALAAGGDIGPQAPEADVDYRSLAAQGIDTILEVCITRVGLTGDGGVNPPLVLSMTSRIRLVQARDNVELYRQVLHHRSTSRKFIEWAAHDARAFREAAEAAYTDLAQKIVRLVLRPPDQAGRERGTRDRLPSSQNADLVQRSISQCFETRTERVPQFLTAKWRGYPATVGVVLPRPGQECPRARIT